MAESSKSKRFGSLFNSIDSLLFTEKEQKLRAKLGREIYNNIFTEEITDKINLCDFSYIDMVDEKSEEIAFLFSTIFPVFIEENEVVFRLYKHKIEVDLSDEMSDRYIFIFSDGRLTSGLFQCFRLYDDEYIYGIKKIINVIPKLKQAIIKAIDNLGENKKNLKEDKLDFKSKMDIAEKNYSELKELIK